jgi:hypothetical protein
VCSIEVQKKKNDKKILLLFVMNCDVNLILTQFARDRAVVASCVHPHLFNGFHLNGVNGGVEVYHHTLTEPGMVDFVKSLRANTNICRPAGARTHERTHLDERTYFDPIQNVLTTFAFPDVFDCVKVQRGQIDAKVTRGFKSTVDSLRSHRVDVAADPPASASSHERTHFNKRTYFDNFLNVFTTFALRNVLCRAMLQRGQVVA